MGVIIINPGTGPVKNASAHHAFENMKAYMRDAKCEDATLMRRPEHDDRGRFAFVLERKGKSVEVEMPGIPLEQVRWMDEPDQSCLDFPRLYVGGSSWLWKFAIDDPFGEEQE